jgi:hypothetical protein
MNLTESCYRPGGLSADEVLAEAAEAEAARLAASRAARPRC